jgi:hypothetical protein
MRVQASARTQIAPDRNFIAGMTVPAYMTEPRQLFDSIPDLR